MVSLSNHAGLTHFLRNTDEGSFDGLRTRGAGNPLVVSPSSASGDQDRLVEAQGMIAFKSEWSVATVI